MEQYIRNENIRHYRRLLETEPNAEKRRIIEQLFADEQAKEHSPQSTPQNANLTNAQPDKKPLV